LSGIGLLQKEGRKREKRQKGERESAEERAGAREMHEDRKEDKRGINGRE